MSSVVGAAAAPSVKFTFARTLLADPEIHSRLQTTNAGASNVAKLIPLFCVGEAVSIPLLRGIWHAAEHPLPKAILGRIVRDEAAHGTFGFAFLDWALPQLPKGEFEQLAATADRAMRQVYETASVSKGAALRYSDGAALRPQYAITPAAIRQHSQ